MAIELDARPRLVRGGSLRQRRERRADPLVDLRRLAAKPRSQIVAAGEGAGLQPERGRVIILSHLNAHTVLPGRRVERPEELATAKAYQRLQSRPAATDLDRLIP